MKWFATTSRQSEQGSMGWVLIASMGALGIATVFVQNITNRQSLDIGHAKYQQGQLKSQEMALTSLSRLKGLLAERQGADAVPIPGLYAVNYYKGVWSLTKNPAITLPQVTMSGTSQFQMNVQSIMDQSPEDVKGILTGGASLLGSSSFPFQGKVIKVHFENSIAQFMEVKVSGPVNSNNKIDMTARIPLPVPQPRDPVVEYSPSGLNTFALLPASLPGGTYDFRVKGSGVVYGARLIVNGGEIHELGGFDKDGNITHNAVSYDSVGEVIGTASVSVGGDLLVDAATCKFAPIGGTYTFQAELIGPDITKVVKGEVKTVPVSVISEKVLTIDDYKTSCVGPTQCPYLGDARDGSLVYENWYTAGGSGDKSDAWSFYEADQFGLKDKKLCINFDSSDRNDPNMAFHDSKMYAYDLATCARQFLFKRDACGCVAEDTMITMGDGVTEKRIDQLVQGDRVWNPILKKSLPILKVTRGPETLPMLKLSLGGKEIKVTSQHPFPTEIGDQTALELRVGDRIQVDGNWQTIDGIESIPAGENPPIVWNLEVEGESWDSHYILANGMLTGDLYIQIKLSQSR